MQGFIEVTESRSKSLVLIAVDRIETIYAMNVQTRLYLNSGSSYTVDESYEEVKRRLQSLFN